MFDASFAPVSVWAEAIRRSSRITPSRVPRYVQTLKPRAQQTNVSRVLEEKFPRSPRTCLSPDGSVMLVCPSTWTFFVDTPRIIEINS